MVDANEFDFDEQASGLDMPDEGEVISLGSESSSAASAPESASTIWIDPKSCSIFPGNGRAGVAFEPARNNALIEDIRRNGQITPVRVRQTEAGYELIAGTRRLGAVLELQKAEPSRALLATVMEANEKQAWALAEKENAERRDLTSIQRARSWAYAVEHFHDGRQDQFAAASGEHASTVSRTLAILKLPPQVLSALRHPENVSVHFACEFAKAIGDDEEKRNEVIEIAERIACEGTGLSCAKLLQTLLYPEQVGPNEPILLAMGSSEAQAVFKRNIAGGAVLSLKPLPPGATDKERRALQKAISQVLSAQLKL